MARRLELSQWPSGSYVSAIWPATSGVQYRPAYLYKPWVPPFIATATPFAVGNALVALTEAESQMERLSSSYRGSGSIADAFVRIEALSSSRIEGLNLNHRSLALALAQVGGASSVAQAVAHNVTAMNKTLELSAEESFSVEMIQEIHAALCVGTQLEEIAGDIRTTQNWIGKGQNGPRPNDYVPPPPEQVQGLLEDLCVFANRKDLPVVFQVAVTHAQFELIHPFADGNGRVGRCLIQAGLVRRLGPDIAHPPISSVLAADTEGYISSLQVYRRGDLNRYIETFSRATIASVGHVYSLTNAFDSLQQQWLQTLDNPRSGSLVRKAVALLPGSPVVDGNRMSSLLNVDVSQAIRTLNTLSEVGILSQATSGKRNRIWLAGEILQILDTYDFSE